MLVPKVCEDIEFTLNWNIYWKWISGCEQKISQMLPFDSHCSHSFIHLVNTGWILKFKCVWKDCHDFKSVTSQSCLCLETRKDDIVNYGWRSFSFCSLLRWKVKILTSITWPSTDVSFVIYNPTKWWKYAESLGRQTKLIFSMITFSVSRRES